MTYNALQFISDILNDFFKEKFTLNENQVLVNRIVNADGSLVQMNENKIVLTLINIEEDASFQRINQPVNRSNEIARHLYSVYILVTANFNDYSESLKQLDAVIDFFNENPVLNNLSKPGFPAELTRIAVEPFKLNFDQLCNLWSSIGAKHQPYIVYKARLM